MSTKPIEPRHQRPEELGEDWGISEWDRRFFPDFDSFADVLNNWFSAESNSAPWRLQELADSETRLHGDYESGPSYGRRYEVFHNQVSVATLEISADWEYTTENPKVHTYLAMEWPRLLPFGRTRDLLIGIALHVCDSTPTSSEHMDAVSQIDRAMLGVMWSALEYDRYDLGPDWGELELHLHGTAKWYLHKRQATSA
jgi:hypothetical protein